MESGFTLVTRLPHFSLFFLSQFHLFFFSFFLFKTHRTKKKSYCVFFSFVCCLFGVGLLINRRSGISFVRARFFSFVNLKEEKKKVVALATPVSASKREGIIWFQQAHLWWSFSFPSLSRERGSRRRKHRKHIETTFFQSFCSSRFFPFCCFIFGICHLPNCAPLLLSFYLSGWATHSSSCKSSMAVPWRVTCTHQHLEREMFDYRLNPPLSFSTLIDGFFILIADQANDDCFFFYK